MAIILEKFKLNEKYIWQNACFLVVLVLSILIIFIGIVGLVALPYGISAFVNQNLYLAEGKETFEKWRETPIPVTFKVYVFNVTNPAEVQAGGTPHMAEVGPYVFEQYRSKEVLSWNDEEKTVTYNDLKSYKFIESLSPVSLDEKVYSVNLPLQGILMFTKKLAYLASSIVQPALEKLLANYNETLFVHRSARELIFQGYKVDLIEDLLELLRPFAEVPEILPNNTFGFLYGKNNSGDGIFTVYTGEDDIRKYTQISSWNGQSKIPFWNDDFCNMMNGTDGSQFPPPVTRKDVLYVYTPDLCRSVFLEYERDVLVQGIPALRFFTPERLFVSPYQNPDNMCYCTEEEYCGLSGILDVSPCRKGLKLAVTGPHFYLAHEFVKERVTGLNPSREAHEVYVDIEPNTGFVLRASRKLQMNFIMQPSKSLSLTEKVAMSVIPLIWVVEEASIDEEVAAMFTAKLRTPVTIAKAVLIACIVLGVLWIATAAFVSVYLLVKQQKTAKSVIKSKYKAVPQRPEDSQFGKVLGNA